jgi:hypothetical protein
LIHALLERPVASCGGAFVVSGFGITRIEPGADREVSTGPES